MLNSFYPLSQPTVPEGGSVHLLGLQLSGVALFSYLHLSHSGFSCIFLPSSYYGLSRRMHSKSGPHRIVFFLNTGSGLFLTSF